MHLSIYIRTLKLILISQDKPLEIVTDGSIDNR